MKINTIKNYRLSFKAQFANDKETQMILRHNSSVHSQRKPSVYSSIQLLKEIETDDFISLKEDVEANDKEVPNFEYAHFIVKNENTGSKIKIAAEYCNPLLFQLNKIIFDHTNPEHYELFADNKPIKSHETFNDIQEYNRYQLKQFSKESGADSVKEKIHSLCKENYELKQKIELNNKKIDKLDTQYEEKQSQYLCSMLGITK